MISGADRIDLPLASYGIADLQRFWKIAVCGLLCGCISTVTDHSNLPSKLGVPTRSPKLESESSEEASNPRTHNLQQDYIYLTCTINEL